MQKSILYYSERNKEKQGEHGTLVKLGKLGTLGKLGSVGGNEHGSFFFLESLRKDGNDEKRALRDP